MSHKKLSIVKVILAALMAGFIIVTSVYSLFSSSYYFFIMTLACGVIAGIPFGIIVSFLFLFSSIKKGKMDIFSFFVIPIIVSLLICAGIFNFKTMSWDDEMYRIAEIIENYYSENGVEKLDSEALQELGIRENIYITINRDRTYYIVNKSKNIVYQSETKTITEENSDY